jgi:hypothetical protein
MEKQKPVSMANMLGGAVIERGDLGLAEANENIKDPNTTLAARKVTITITLKPMDEHRHMIGYTVDVKTTLCGLAPMATTGMMSLDSRGRAVVTENNPDIYQPKLPGMDNVATAVFGQKGSD